MVQQTTECMQGTETWQPCYMHEKHLTESQNTVENINMGLVFLCLYVTFSSAPAKYHIHISSFIVRSSSLLIASIIKY